ncbi:MAG: DUF2141 domain-containing protein [Deltaproteobacteria bacterium]|nr:DUF2141 domain-containing protein [Deltaproteobacteria bacterium]
MNASIHPKYAADFTAKDFLKCVLLKVWCVLSFAMLVIANLPNMASAQSSFGSGIYVKVLNISSSVGTEAYALFDSSVYFPIEFPRYATNIVVVEIRYAVVRGDLSDILPETYEFAIIHDENMDGKLDTNRLNIPTEGHGFSNDVKTMIRPPSFSDAGFPYDGEYMGLTISLHY